MDEDGILAELRLQTAILRAAFHEQLTNLSGQLHEDKPTSAVLAVLAEHGTSLPSRELQNRVIILEPSAGRRTITRRLAYLESIGVVIRTGAGPATAYESTGLVS